MASFSSLSTTHRIVMAAAVVVAVPVCPKESVLEPPKNAGVVCAVCGSRKHMTSESHPLLSPFYRRLDIDSSVNSLIRALSGLAPNIRVYPAGG